MTSIARVSGTLFCVLSLAVGGCSSTKVLTAQEYMDEGNKAMDAEVYDLAVESYQKLLEEHPFDPATEEAQLKTAHALFLDERYPEAIASFQDFMRMHPTNASLPFAEFHIALAFQRQVGDRDRDHRAAQNAEVHYRTVLDRYPDSAYAAEARTHLQEVREFLADHEFGIARFYLLWDNPLGAESRLRHLLGEYPDTEKSAEGLAVFAKYFHDRGDLQRSATAWATILRQYPKSTFAVEAQQEIDELAAIDVRPPDDPLPALVETLGRPSTAAASDPQPAATPAQAAGPIDRPNTIR